MAGSAAVREFELIEKLFRRESRRPDVVLGIGDDAALTRVPVGVELVTATDTLVCGTHFVVDAPADSVGHRVLAANLSDLAAMGADPLWASLAINLPAPDSDWLADFAAGLFNLADKYSVELIGGDTVRGPLSATLTLQGSVPTGQAVLRAGATAGDLIFVTGSPGDAAAGRLLMSGELLADPSAGETVAAEQLLQQRFLYPQPRVAMGGQLRMLASAMIDISDGVQADLQHLLAAGNVGAVVQLEDLPVSNALTKVSDISRAHQLALCGGDDYELCFTIPPEQAGQVTQLAAGLDCPVTQIGVIDAGNGLRCFRNGELAVVPDSSFRHFE